MAQNRAGPDKTAQDAPQDDAGGAAVAPVPSPAPGRRKGLRAVPGTADAASGPSRPRREADPAPAPAPATVPDTVPDPAGGAGGDEPPRRGKKKGGKKAPEPETRVIEIAPPAGRARMRFRHWGLILSFVLVVLLPLGGTGAYLWRVAADQYASTVGFTVRQEEGGAATDMMTGLAAQLSGGGGSSDSDILNEFIRSHDMVTRVDDRLDLRAIFSRPWPEDPVFAMPPDVALEDLVSYWQRMVRVSYDQGTGLIEVQALAFRPDEARAIAQEIVVNSQQLINDLNATARSDTLAFAERDLQAALERLRAAREALASFRTRTQIVDPASDIQGRMGVLNNLQQQLAQALIDYDLLRDTAAESDPRRGQAQRRIDVIRERIVQERGALSNGSDTSAGGDDYPNLISEFESLSVDREYAEEGYRAALAALDLARTEAQRQTRYLATYIAPSEAQRADYPQRWVLFGLAALFLVMAWAIMALVYYSIRDRR